MSQPVTAREIFLGISCPLQDEKTLACLLPSPSNTLIIVLERISSSIKCGLIDTIHFDMPRLACTWIICLLLCTARHSPATFLDNNLDPLSGGHENALLSSTFAPPPISGSGDSLVALPFSGSTTPNGVDNDQGDEGVLDIPTNDGNRGTEPLVLSESSGCGFNVNQAPHEHRRRIRRGDGNACLTHYPITSPGNGNPSQEPPSPTSSESSQDSPGEAEAEGLALGKESAQSPPAADPFRCPYFNHPIPVCGSYLWARNAISPYTLPSCAPSMCLCPPFHTRSYPIKGLCHRRLARVININ